MKKIIQPCGLHCMKIKNLGVTFADQVVLHDINLHLHCGSLTAVIGRNGAGKSTLVRAMLGDVPHTGTIECRDTKNGHMQKIKIGYVPQSLGIEKDAPISVYDMIAAYQGKMPVFFKKGKKLYQEIQEALRVFQAEQLIDQQVCNLSGGQLQRVLLSMAIMDEPHLLLLDEPVSGIDQNGMDLFYKTMDDLRKNFDLAILLISHDLDYVARFADQVVLIDQTVRKQGSVHEVYSSPEFVQVFGKVDYAGGRLQDKKGEGQID